ncbi:MAG: hypothetical protein CME81_05285 [Halomonas sp.]|nr:hypothetical protein [Halomonas sp.]|tara:strand:- start:596 stop:904 length:309 start_codon:yes stop_codon:yes gene_type:complete
MTYPATIPAVREAILAYTPNVEAARDLYDAALVNVSIVNLSVRVFEALSPHTDDLNEEGRKVLTGCSKLILEGGWHGKTLEAALVFNKLAAEFEATPAEEEG